MKLLLITLLFFKQLNVYQSVIYMKLKDSEVERTGPSKTVIILKAYDAMFYELEVDGYFGCDYYYSNHECDTLFKNNRACRTYLKYSEKWTSEYNDQKNYPKKKLGICDKMADYEGPTNQNYVTGINKELYRKSLTKFAYKYLIIFTWYDYNPVRNELFRDLSFPKIKTNISLVKYALIDRKKYPDYFSMIYFTIQSFCNTNYHGQNCWYKCENCNCPKKLRNEAKMCPFKCSKDGIVKTISTVFVDDFRYTFDKCNVFDYCKLEGKNCTKTCFQTANNTGFCYEIRPVYTSQFHESNITSSIFYESEIVVITLPNNAYKSLTENSYFTYVKKSKIIITEIITIKMDGNCISFVINDANEPDVPVFFNYTISFAVWKLNFKFQNEIVIYVKPRNANFYNMETNEILYGKIQLGTIIVCNATSIPHYRTLTFISLRDFGGGSISGTSYEIPYKIKTIKNTVQCVVKLISIKRQNEEQKVTKNIQLLLRSSIYFKPRANIISKSKKLKCVSHLEDMKLLIMFQLTGETILVQSNGTFSLNNAYKGLYEVGCVSSSDTFRRTIRLKFSITSPLTKICFFLFPFTQGSLAQCSHNGFIYDLYEIKISIQYESKEIIANQTSNRIRIPYAIKSRYIEIKCTVNNKDKHDEFKTKTLKLALAIDTYYSYKFTDEHRMCLKNDFYGDKLSIRTRFRDSVVLNQHVFICSFVRVSDFEMALFANIMVISLTLVLVMILALNSAGFKGLGTIEKTIIRVYRINRLRIFQELLAFKVKNYIAIKAHENNYVQAPKQDGELYFHSFSSLSTFMVNDDKK